VCVHGYSRVVTDILAARRVRVVRRPHGRAVGGGGARCHGRRSALLNRWQRGGQNRRYVGNKGVLRRGQKQQELLDPLARFGPRALGILSPHWNAKHSLVSPKKAADRQSATDVSLTKTTDRCSVASYSAGCRRSYNYFEQSKTHLRSFKAKFNLLVAGWHIGPLGACRPGLQGRRVWRLGDLGAGLLGSLVLCVANLILEAVHSLLWRQGTGTLTQLILIHGTKRAGQGEGE